MSAGERNVAKEHFDGLIAYARTFTTDKARRNVAAIANTPQGRKSVEDGLALLRLWQPAIAEANREVAKAIPVMVKALKASRPGILA